MCLRAIFFYSNSNHFLFIWVFVADVYTAKPSKHIFMKLLVYFSLEKKPYGLAKIKEGFSSQVFSPSPYLLLQRCYIR